MNEQLQQIVRGVIELLVAGKYKDLEDLTGRVRLSANEMATAIADYGREMVLPPDSAFELMDIIEAVDTQPRQWSITMPLWTREEGRSDLSLEITVIAVDNGPVIELDDIHVL